MSDARSEKEAPAEAAALAETSAEVDQAQTSAEAATEEIPATPVDPDEALKAKYREALAHKHGTSGAHKTTHGDHGEAAHSQSNGPTQKMFRRKAGG